MTAKKRTIVVGVFRDRRDAERAVYSLRELGFRNDRIGILIPGELADDHVSLDEMGSKIGEGAIGGALAGAGIGTLAGLAVVAGLMPAVGPAIAGGSLASILSSAGLGAAAGSFAGALIGLGVPEDEARYFDQEFQAGRTLVTVKTTGRSSEARNCLHSHGAYGMHMPRPATNEPGAKHD